MKPEENSGASRLLVRGMKTFAEVEVILPEAGGGVGGEMIGDEKGSTTEEVEEERERTEGEGERKRCGVEGMEWVWNEYSEREWCE